MKPCYCGNCCDEGWYEVCNRECECEKDPAGIEPGFAEQPEVRIPVLSDDY